MFVRGANDSPEYKREENSFFRGIVVANNDPEKMYRIKIFVPEVCNQPLEGWLQSFVDINFRFPGTNNTKDNLTDTNVFDKIAELVPWAEPCAPLFGESGAGRYNASLKTGTITDSNFIDSFRLNDSIPISKEQGAFAPAFLYEHKDLCISDAYTDPSAKMITNLNPYSFLGRPSNYTNKPKGLFGIPQIGSKVWLFYHRGDLNFPIYFGVVRDYRESIYINNLDSNDKNQSLDYPGIFENK